MIKNNLSRRQFLGLCVANAVGFALASCAQAPEPPKTSPTTAPTTPAKTAASTAPTTPPVVPTKYKEAPELAKLVAEGKLPPVEKRLPSNPLVLKPIDGIGKYGGRMRQFSADLLDYGFQLQQYGYSPMRYIDDGLAIAPGTCESFETNKDNTEWTLHFRKGLKWSDGEPCTVDDILFWFEDLVKVKDSNTATDPIIQAGGKLCEMTKIDADTLKMKFAVPAVFTHDRLAMRQKGAIQLRWIAPKHYLSKFHPKYNPDVKTFDEFWKQIEWQKGTGCPTLGHWMVSKFDPGKRRETVRNPYYYAVDTDGNQLPYIDGTDEVSITDAEVQKLTIMQGGVDYITRHFHSITMSDLNTMLSNEDKGNYKVYFRDGGDGTGRIFYLNHDYQDPKIRAIYRNPKFQRALSYAHDRPTIQKIVYFNTGILTTGTMSPKAIEFNFSDEAKKLFEKWRTAYIEFDPTKSKALLDEIGMKDVNGDGWRELPDGTKFELRIDLAANASAVGLQVLEIATKNWKDIGLNVVINQKPLAEFNNIINNGQMSMRTDWEVGDGPNFWVYPHWIIPIEQTRWAPLAGRYIAVKGTSSEKTETEKSPWDRQPPRFNENEKDLISDVVVRLQEIYEKVLAEPDITKRHQMAWDVANIHINEGPFFIGNVANTPTLEFVSKNLMNVPTRAQLKTGGFTFPGILPHPAVWNPETYSFTDKPIDKKHGL